MSPQFLRSFVAQRFGRVDYGLRMCQIGGEVLGDVWSGPGGFNAGHSAMGLLDQAALCWELSICSPARRRRGAFCSRWTWGNMRPETRGLG